MTTPGHPSASMRTRPSVAPTALPVRTGGTHAFGLGYGDMFLLTDRPLLLRGGACLLHRRRRRGEVNAVRAGARKSGARGRRGGGGAYCEEFEGGGPGPGAGAGAGDGALGLVPLLTPRHVKTVLPGSCARCKCVLSCEHVVSEVRHVSRVKRRRSKPIACQCAVSTL